MPWVQGNLWDFVPGSTSDLVVPALDFSSDGEWPSPFTQTVAGTAADTYVEDGEGVLLTTTEAGTFKAARVISSTNFASDIRFTGTMRHETPREAQYIQLSWRMNGFSGDSDFPDIGYAWSFRPFEERFELLITQGGGFSIHDGFDFLDFSGSTPSVNFDISHIGDVVTCYAWLLGDSKPASPNYQESVPVVASHNKVGFSHASSAAARHVWWSNIRIYEL